MRFTRNEEFTWRSTGDNENKWSAGQRNDCRERVKLGIAKDNAPTNEVFKISRLSINI